MRQTSSDRLNGLPLTLFGIFVVAFALLSNSANATSLCDSLIAARKAAPLPSCPRTRLLAENFPLGAILLNQPSGTKNYGEGTQERAGYTPFMTKLISKIRTASGEYAPAVLLVAQPDSVTKIQNQIQDSSFIVPLVPKAGTFVQDPYFVGISKSGAITFSRFYLNYGEDDDYMLENFGSTPPQVMRAVEAACPTSIHQDGAILPAEAQDSIEGGNILAIGQNICAVGSAAASSILSRPELQDSICGEGVQRVDADTSWLWVGHVDEVIAVIPAPAATGSCKFAVAIASPRLALNLLKENPGDSFFNFSKSDFSAEDAERISQVGVWTGFCQSYFGSQKFDATTCAQLTNGQVAEFLSQNPSAKRIVSVAQADLDRLNLDLKAALQAQHCGASVIEVPALYFQPKEFELTMESKLQTQSLLPNSLNGILVNSTVIAPDPLNSVFRNYIKTKYSEFGAHADFIDDSLIYYPHGGELHCASKSFRLCTP